MAMQPPNGSATLTKAFVDALEVLERDRDVTLMTALFDRDATLANLTVEERGEAAPARFWERYLDQFANIRSEFSRIIEGEGATALAWRSRGALKDGRPVDYLGVSILTARDGKIAGFQRIYDGSAFVRAMPSPAAQALAPS